jgi:hypothetical protein
VPQQNDVGEAGASASNFIRSIIASDVETGRTRVVVTRFPPEPNGYLHLGHAKSIVLNYDLAKEFGGRCNLRLDDTNPAKERVEYIDAIKRDVQWLGCDWAQGLSVRTCCRSSLKPISTLRSPPDQDPYASAVNPRGSQLSYSGLEFKFALQRGNDLSRLAHYRRPLNLLSCLEGLGPCRAPRPLLTSSHRRFAE